MNLITKRQLIDAVANNWKKQYFRNGAWLEGIDPPSKQTYLKLEELKTGASEDQIAAIIGNRTWTQNKCNECGKDCEAVVQLGELPDYDSATANICLACLTEAMELISTVKVSA